MHGGERLGDGGSCIVAETIVAHIRNAEISILADASINSLADIPRFSMADLLLKVDDLTPV